MVSMNWKYCISYFFISVANPRIYAVGSKLLNLWEVLFRGILFYIVCLDVSDIDRQKFRRYGWDNLFLKSNVGNKLAVDIFREQRNNLMLGLALNGLGSAYSLPL